MIIYSDSSRSGWGALSENIRTGRPWVSEDLMLHINGLELLAAFYAIKSFVGQELGLFIHIVLNNTTHYNTTYNNIHITT